MTSEERKVFRLFQFEVFIQYLIEKLCCLVLFSLRIKLFHNGLLFSQHLSLDKLSNDQLNFLLENIFYAIPRCV